MNMNEACANLEARFPTLDITSAGGICPFQAEGTLRGVPFYFRFRHSFAELRIQGADWFKPLYMAGGEYGELCTLEPDAETEDVGWLHGEEFDELLGKLIQRLERAPVLWEFPGIEPNRVGNIEAGTPTTYGAWGSTAEQAWAAMHKPSQYLRSKGIDDAVQAQHLAARNMSPITVTVDDRVFPNPDPFAATQP